MKDDELFHPKLMTLADFTAMRRVLPKGYRLVFTNGCFDILHYVLAGLEAVDFVVIFDEDTPLELIRAIHPQVLVKGGDWIKDKIVGRDVVEEAGGQVVSLPLLPGYSTTGLIARILKA